MMRTRFAPTPSGYLHDGNVVNLLLVSWLREQHQGELALRIDALDADRQRPEYLQDIFETLSWLDVRWEIGPQSFTDVQPSDAYDHWRQRALDLRREHQGKTGLRSFVCRCSRRELAQSGSRSCIADCARVDLELVTNQNCLRLELPEQYRSLGHPVLWRREGIPAYHLASVLADDELGITHVVRGEDLREATQIQLLLAEALGADHVSKATFLHHGLVRAADGTKLSKSTLAHGSPAPKTAARRAALIELARAFGRPLGIAPHG
jgi:glutamyl/glutaminyl-tRNA synthetase